MDNPEISNVGPVVDADTPARALAQRLRNTLRLNASVSLTGGLIAIIAHEPLAQFLGTTPNAGRVRVVGVALAAFAIAVGGCSARRATTLRRYAPVIVAADLAWVLGTAIAIASGWFQLPGALFLAGVAAVVGTFAWRQWSSARALTATGRLASIDEYPPTEVVHIERSVDAPVNLAWRIVVDHELYGRLAPNLGRVSATAPNGPGLSRVCTDRANRSWSEACSLWDDGHQFDIVVDTTDYPYPLTEMRGSWWVTEGPTSGSSVVGMDFRHRPRTGIGGAAFSAVMQAAFPIVLSRILRGWQRAALATVPISSGVPDTHQE